MKKFYRVSNVDTQQGLWYNFDGTFTGLIHNRFDFCANSKLCMDFDEELVGWLSATDELETLFNWFTPEDIQRLEEHGWYIYEFYTTEYKWYDRFQHWVIKQDNHTLGERVLLNQTVKS